MAATRNILAFDIGDRRIGVALATLEARMASPLVTIDRQQHTDALAALMELVGQYEAGAVVIGLPRGMEGQETKQTALVRTFAADFQKVCTAPVHLQDEAGTSLAAVDTLEARGKPYAKGDIDKTAAALILQDWLDHQPMEVTS